MEKAFKTNEKLTLTENRGCGMWMHPSLES
jgi:hypothetical protein